MSFCEKSAVILKRCFWVSSGLAILLLFPLVLFGERFFLLFRDNNFAQTDIINLHPSVSICQVFNGERNWDLSEKYFGIERDKRLDDFLTEISFYAGACYTCELCNNELNCPRNFTEVLNLFRDNCQNLIQNCSWNDEPFECCEEFLPLDTEFGTCFSIKSDKYFLSSESENIFGRLKMMITEDIQMIIHRPNEIPYTHDRDRLLNDRVLWGSIKDMVIKVTEGTYDKSLAKKPLRKRHCRFPWEKDPASIYDAYSMSTCETSCYARAQMKYCSCSNHLMPMDQKLNIPVCDINGLICLTENFMNITTARKNCSCVPSCDAIDYEVIYNNDEEMGNDDRTEVTISIVELPSTRHECQTIANYFNLVILTSGTFGLFIGIFLVGFVIAFRKILKTRPKKAKIIAIEKNAELFKAEELKIAIIDNI